MNATKVIAAFAVLLFCAFARAAVPVVLDHWFDTTWKTTGADFCELAANFQAAHKTPKPGFTSIAYTFTYGSNDGLGATTCVFPRNSDIAEINEFNVAGYRAGHIEGIYKFNLYEYGQRSNGWSYAENYAMLTPVPIFVCPPNSGNLNKGNCTCFEGFIEHAGSSCVTRPRNHRRSP